LSKVFKWLGAKNAMNLDGGGSSTLYIRNATDNGVVNYPSDNKKFDHEGQRSVANIIYLK
jgi:exopolysaccharide biosynthesis protein